MRAGLVGSIVVVALVVFGAPGAARADVTVEALGQAKSAAGADLETVRRRALDDALRQAVDGVIGDLVAPETRKLHGETLKTRVLRRAKAYVVTHKVLGEGDEGGVYQVHVEAVVADGALRKDLTALGVPLVGEPVLPPPDPGTPVAPRGRQRAAVIVEGPAEGLGAALVAALEAAGIAAVVVPVSGAGAEGADDGQVAAAASAQGAPIALVVSAAPVDEGRVRGTTKVGAAQVLLVRIVEPSTDGPKRRGDTRLAAGGSGMDPAAARAELARVAAARLAAWSAPRLAEKVAAPAATATGVIVVVRGVVRWKEPAALAAALAQVPGVTRVEPLGAARGELRYRVVGRVGVDALARAVPPALGATARGEGGALEVELLPPPSAAPATPPTISLVTR